MQIRNSPAGYGAVTQALHWLTACLVAVAWILGNVGDDWRAGQFVHVTVGLSVFAVLIVRLLWRMVDPPPLPEPTPFGKWGDRLARATHYLLYGLLAIVPISGIVLQFARGDALPVFGFIEIASPVAVARSTARAVNEVHEVLSNGLLLVAAAHAAAAAIHHWVMRDRTLLRMLPGRR